MAGRTKTPKTAAKSNRSHPSKKRPTSSSSPFTSPQPAEPKGPNRVLAIIRSMNTQDTR